MDPSPFPATHTCEACGDAFDPGTHAVCYESSYLMLNVCPGCMDGYIRQFGTVCVNCEERIPPHTQVAVYKTGEETHVGHTTVVCNPAGNTFYGYWGKGKLNSVFRCIEAC
ncbi:MAG: hypothetical protein ACE5FN_09370 [Leptospirillia bacterium]